MGRLCSVCGHADRKQIDTAIVDGVGVRALATRYGLSKDAVARHADTHLPGTLTRAADAAEAAHADTLLTEIRAREQRADELGRKAERDGDLRTALQALREWRGLAEFRAKVAGELDERAVVNVMLSPEWVRIREVLIGALADHPEARLAVAAALGSLEGIGGGVRP